MSVNVNIEDDIFNRVKEAMDIDVYSPSQLINRFLLEKLDGDGGANIVTSSCEIQKLLAHDNPEGINPFKDLAGIIDIDVLLLILLS